MAIMLNMPPRVCHDQRTTSNLQNHVGPYGGYMGMMGKENGNYYRYKTLRLYLGRFA